MDLTGLSSFANLITELIRAYRLIMGAFNDPAMVTAKMNQMAQEFSQHVDQLQSVLQDPDATPEQKQKAFEELRLTDSGS